MRAIDTNVLVRLIARDDESQVEAAERFVLPGVWLSHVVLAEAMWVLRSTYGVEKDSLAATIESLLTQPALVFQEPDVVEKALETYRGQSGADFSDCLILESARKAGHHPLGTFDRKLARLDGCRLLS